MIRKVANVYGFFLISMLVIMLTSPASALDTIDRDLEKPLKIAEQEITLLRGISEEAQRQITQSSTTSRPRLIMQFDEKINPKTKYVLEEKGIRLLRKYKCQTIKEVLEKQSVIREKLKKSPLK